MDDFVKGLMAGGAIQLISNNRLAKSMKETGSRIHIEKKMCRELENISGKLDNISEQQSEMIDLQKKIFLENQKQTRMQEIESERKQVERFIKETVFQLRQHLNFIDSLSSPLEQLIMYRATANSFNSFNISHIDTSKIDSINDKVFLVNTISLLQDKVKEAAFKISNKEIKEFEKFKESWYKKKQLKNKKKSLEKRKIGLDVENAAHIEKLIDVNKNICEPVSWWKLLTNKYSEDKNDIIKGNHMIIIFLVCLCGIFYTFNKGVRFPGNILFDRLLILIVLIIMCLGIFSLFRFCRRGMLYDAIIVCQYCESKNRIASGNRFKISKCGNCKFDLASNGTLKERLTSRMQYEFQNIYKSLKSKINLNENNIKEIVYELDNCVESSNEFVSVDNKVNQFLDKHNNLKGYVDIGQLVKL